MLVAQFTRLFKSHAYRLFCFIVKIDGYNYKPRISTHQCQCIVCGNDLTKDKRIKMAKNKHQLADNSQIEELKASLVKASANISRLEYICNTQEHELKMLSEKLVDYRGIKDVVKDIKDGLDELKSNVSELQTKQEPIVIPHRIDPTFENRLNCLENIAKDVEDQDGYFKALEQDTEELRQELVILKEMCERIEQENRIERTTDSDYPIWTISSESFQRTTDSTYGSHDESNVAMTEESYSDKSSFERDFKSTVISFDTFESSLARELSVVNSSNILTTSNPNVELSNTGVSSQSNSNSLQSLTNNQEPIRHSFSCLGADKVDSKIVDSDNYKENYREIEIICENKETSPEMSRNQNLSSKSDSLDIEEVKVCISETSTAETLKCESSIDPLNDFDELEQKDMGSNEQSCSNNLLYYLLTICTHVFD